MAATPGAAAQGVEHCAPAARFLAGEMAMEIRVEPDTLDDWRTGQRAPACRITAAGARRASLRAAAGALYERLQAAGWRRTPDPSDAPNESSLRLRMGATDCVFNVYQGILLGTEAEIAVTTTLATRPGEERYHVLALCVAATG